jgi:hypothetical protein
MSNLLFIWSNSQNINCNPCFSGHFPQNRSVADIHSLVYHIAKIVVLGTYISGHTSAAFLKKTLGRNHEVVVVSPGAYYTHSVCSCDHTVATWKELQECIKRMERRGKVKLLIGTGHPAATCQGAVFEYALNVAYEIRSLGLMQMAEITWISNEFELGDFGMGGAFIKCGGYITPTKVFSESISAEYDIKWTKSAGVMKAEKG